MTGPTATGVNFCTLPPARLCSRWRRGRWRARAQTAGGAALKIGMIGSGREGGALGAALIKAGHPVMFSSRHPEELKSLVDGLGPLAKAGTVDQAIEFGDVVMIVVPYGAMQQIGHDYGAALAKKMLVIDVSNPIARRDGADLVKSVDEQGGAGLATAKMLPGAHLVRAFNAIGSAKIAADAHRAGELVGVPIAGDDHARDRGRFGPYSRDRLRAGADRRARDGQISGSGNAARRRAFSPAEIRPDRRRPQLSRALSDRLYRLLRRFVEIRREEVPVVGWCWLSIFSVLSSYYIMRPIRDEAGVAGGVNNLQWLFTGTLLGMVLLNIPFAFLVKTAAAPPLHPDHLPFLRRQYRAVRRPPSLGRCANRRSGSGESFSSGSRSTIFLSSRCSGR